MDPKQKAAYDTVMSSPIANANPAMTPPTQPNLSTPSLPIGSPQMSSGTTLPAAGSTAGLMDAPLQSQVGAVIQSAAPAVQPIQAPPVQPEATPVTSGPTITPFTQPQVSPQPGVNPTAAVPPQQSTVHIDYMLKKPASSSVSFGKKKLGIPPVLYIVGCILFFVLYTLFWAKVFGLPIPYLG